MRGRIFLILLILNIVSCSEEELPIGIYDYQVERLLSGETGLKTWSQVVNSTDCTDSVNITFELIANAANDSLDITMITGCANSSNTTLLGRASASSPEGGILFTDSLIFDSGDFWIIDQITSEQLSLRIDEVEVQYVLE